MTARPKIIPSSISVYEHDMYRTRENEGKDICDGCPLLDTDCGKDPEECKSDLADLFVLSELESFLHEGCKYD